MKAILESMQGLSSASCAGLVQLIPLRGLRRKKNLKQCMFQSSGNSALREIFTKQNRQVVVQALLASHLFEEKEGQTTDVFLTPFHDKSFTIRNVNGGGYVQLLLIIQGHRTEPSFRSISTPMSFELQKLLDSPSMFPQL